MLRFGKNFKFRSLYCDLKCINKLLFYVLIELLYSIIQLISERPHDIGIADNFILWYRNLLSKQWPETLKTLIYFILKRDLLSHLRWDCAIDIKRWVIYLKYSRTPIYRSPRFTGSSYLLPILWFLIIPRLNISRSTVRPDLPGILPFSWFNIIPRLDLPRSTVLSDLPSYFSFPERPVNWGSIVHV